DEEILMISGHPPVRARKLRYFGDRNFTERVLPPPSPSAAGTCDVPRASPHDWLAAPLPLGGHQSPRGTAAIAGVEDEGGGLSREESIADTEVDESRPKALGDLIDLDRDFETGDLFEPEPALERAVRLAPLDPDDGLPL
ncbi:conjugal transfer protein TraG, partial [mine drainage metagenome]